jgi:hypothetical protein
LFYIQQSKIPESVLATIMDRIKQNNQFLKRIEEKEIQIEEKESKQKKDDKGNSVTTSKRESGRLSNESQKWMTEIQKLRAEIKLVALEPVYVPNTNPHQHVWAPGEQPLSNAFVANIGEAMAKEIMMLDVDVNKKILLLIGIGMFCEDPNPKYMEIMKQLADEQRLFMIIASSDYVFGTNYQFCHGYIGKDLQKMTKQKTLQALGRLGRNNIQQTYTARFRDDDMIKQLFLPASGENLEADNMCRLFTTD